MNLLALLAYAGVNTLMVLSCLICKRNERFFEFPFWVGTFGLGWFLPQAVGGYVKIAEYPEGAYAPAMFFATLCSVALWLGYKSSVRKPRRQSSWLMMRFDAQRLYWACAILCMVGFFFYWKLRSLPEELITTTEFGQWTGTSVKYLFLSDIFKIGFIGLLLQYLTRKKILQLKFLIFILPGLLLLVLPIILAGRRADMMNLLAYVAFPLWFVRRIAIPKVVLIPCLACGLLFINAIGLYRSVMFEESDLPLMERLDEAVTQDYLAKNKESLSEAGPEFEKYLYRMDGTRKLGACDYGLFHWNMLVFNYVPAQIVGQKIKSMLMIPVLSPSEAGYKIHGFIGMSGATHTGYMDAFFSFSWLGFIKFFLVGWIMGALYRYAVGGLFLGQLLYPYMLTVGMHAVSHTTNDILVRMWIYFFMLGFPLFYWAKARIPRKAILH